MAYVTRANYTYIYIYICAPTYSTHAHAFLSSSILQLRRALARAGHAQLALIQNVMERIRNVKERNQTGHRCPEGKDEPFLGDAAGRVPRCRIV